MRQKSGPEKQPAEDAISNPPVASRLYGMERAVIVRGCGTRIVPINDRGHYRWSWICRLDLQE